METKLEVDRHSRKRSRHEYCSVRTDRSQPYLHTAGREPGFRPSLGDGPSTRGVATGAQVPLPSCQRACSAALLWVYRYLEGEDPQGIWSQAVEAVFARGRVTDQVSCPNRELLAVAPHHALTVED